MNCRLQRDAPKVKKTSELMAQDFYAAFGVGEDNRHITSIDEDGVALAAIKALNVRVAQKDVALHALRGR